MTGVSQGQVDPEPGTAAPATTAEGDLGALLTVLLIEDSEVDAVLVSEMLGQARGLKAQMVRCDRLETGLLRLANGGVDVVLLDLSLPDSRGLETFEQVSATGADVPIIVMSAHREEDLAVTAVRNGAQDYLMKGQVTIESLARAIQYGVERHRLLASIRGLSLVDDLTGLCNRRGFLSLGTSHLQLSQRAGRRFIMLYADLDGLKEINDTFGHREGDVAIVKTAEILRRTFRMSDVVARMGGDEFVVLAVEAGNDPSQALLRRVQRQLDEFNAESRLPYELSVSAGVMAYDFTSPLTLEEMLAEADQALYVRKRGRRKTTRLRSPVL
jgi:diguanylate cyclase (GGDEF)-like protein